MELWLYTKDDPCPNMPLFVGTRSYCKHWIERMVRDFPDEIWTETDNRNWENVHGDKIRMEMP